MSIHRRGLIGLALPGALGASLPARAQAGDPGITVDQPWARAAIQGGAGGAFLTIRNTGPRPDRLVSASTPAARAVEIHETAREGEVMRMRPIAGIDVPAGSAVTLRPGGIHVMMVGLAEALRPGATVPLTLHFERAGAVEVQLAVRAAGASGPAAPGHRH